MGSTTTLPIPAQHPAFDGHFPGAPLLPAVVLLDEMLRIVQETVLSVGQGGTQEGGVGHGWTIATAKFLQPVRPGETLTFEHERLPNGALRFVIRSAGHPVASGTLVSKLATHEPDNGHQTG